MSFTRGRILQRYYRKLFIIGLSLVGAAFITSSSAYGEVFVGNPQNYDSQLDKLKAGDTLLLEAGIYEDGISINNLHGEPDKPIIITGPETGEPAVFMGSRHGLWNTVQFKDSSYLTFRYLKLDGQNAEDIDAVNARGLTHHITLENLEIVRHGATQTTVGIATRGPAWDWIIRNCKIIGAGTGMYLGDSRGTRWPFVGGLVEHNLIVDTVGYNVQFKHTISRTDVNGNVIPGMPQEKRKTIIRHNVFSKASQPSPPHEGARPNLLVGHFPLSGPGSDDVYEIYGNFFYENTTEALFQGEGNIALYNNVFINSSGDAVNIQSHNDVPRNINVFHNTVVATGGGISVNDVHADFAQRVAGNAIFAGAPLSIDSQQVVQRDNVTSAHASASDYLLNPDGAPGLRELNLFPLEGTLQGDIIDMMAFQSFSDWDFDFNGDSRTGFFRGAYAGEVNNNGWALTIDFKPHRDTPLTPPGIITQPKSVTVTEGEDITYSVVVTGSGPLSYQWYFKGGIIEDANSASYTLTGVSATDAGTYGCIVGNGQGNDSCSDFTLEVSADDTPPTLVTALATSITSVNLLFSEAVEQSSAENSDNYELNLGGSVNTASLNVDERTVSLTVNPALTEDTTYEISVSNVQDRAQDPNTIVMLSSKMFTYRTVDDFEDGLTDGWTPYNGGPDLEVNRWAVVDDEGDKAYYLKETDYEQQSGKRLGEYSLLSAEYTDFTFTAQTKLGDDVAVNAFADYAVLFGFEDNDNYYYVMLNNDRDETALFKVVDGTREALKQGTSTDWLNDNFYHSIKVSRQGSEIRVYFDDNEIMKATDDTFGVGQVGVGSYNDSAYFDDVQVVGEVTAIANDTTPPMIALIGSSPLTIDQGAVYIDAGAKATDNKDNDDTLTGKINVSGSVDTSIAATYTLTYNVTDEADNAAIAVTRTVIVEAVVIDDTEAPVITLEGSSPFTIDQGAVYIDAGAKATDNKDNDDTLTGKINVSGSVDTSIAATYTLTYNVTDEADNAAIAVTRTVIVEAVATSDPDDPDSGGGALGPLFWLSFILLALRFRRQHKNLIS